MNELTYARILRETLGRADERDELIHELRLHVAALKSLNAQNDEIIESLKRTVAAQERSIEALLTVVRAVGVTVPEGI